MNPFPQTTQISKTEIADNWEGPKEGMMLEREAANTSLGVRAGTGTPVRHSLQPLFFPAHLPPKWTRSGRSPGSGPHLQGRLYLNIPDR